jgi:Asp-tRNA(Asn)/Glu-tRNA(Gln) amidotransferase A subunit family amidase
MRAVPERSPKLERIERDVERRLREIAESVTSLPGAGAPLRDTSHTGETWAARHIMENANAAPGWADLRRDIDERLARLHRRVAAHREWLHDRTKLLAEVPADRILETTHATTARDLRVRADLEKLVGEVNALIRRYDLLVVPAMQLPLVTLERLAI